MIAALRKTLGAIARKERSREAGPHASAAARVSCACRHRRIPIRNWRQKRRSGTGDIDITLALVRFSSPDLLDRPIVE